MNNVTTRFEEAAIHYKKYRTAILEAGRSEWGVDPYEWECFADLTPIESNLWACIRSVDAVFYPQYPIGRFFADFCNPVAGVVIECDGAKWHQDTEKDAKRQAVIEAEGFTVYRITGKQCQDEAFANAFVQDIAFRHDLIRGCRDCCVAWDFAAKRYVVAGIEDAKNINAGKALDGQPGIAIVRDRLHVQEAWRISKALNVSLRITGDLV